jgi:hypothetical protein
MIVAEAVFEGPGASDLLVRLLVQLRRLPSNSLVSLGNVIDAGPTKNASAAFRSRSLSFEKSC